MGFLEQAIEYRAYAQAKAMNDADQGKHAHTSPMRTLALEIEMELAEERIGTDGE